MPKNKCCGCKDRFEKETMIRLPAGLFHSIECATQYANKRQLRNAQIASNKQKKALKTQHKADKAKLKKRTGKNGYYDNLKTALHYYVKHVLRKGEPCYTCDNPQTENNCHHVGHFIPAKQVDPRRFLLSNLRIQCYSCNSMNSGKRAEYRQRLISEMGIEHVEWLECDANHLSLNEQFPTVEDIKAEIKKYRKLSAQSRQP